MRKITATTLALVIVQLVLLASGTQSVYSEGVPREVVAINETKMRQIEQKKPSTVVSALTTPLTPVATPVVKRKTSTPVITGNHLSIPSIGFVAPVINVGVTASNTIDVPSGRQVGYWTKSATPGTAGTVFLNGHVDGVFATLPRIAVGQIVSLRYGDQVYSYRVVHKEIMPLASIDMNRALRAYGGAIEGLNMMTCAGKYVPSLGTYDHRLVVYAVRI